MRTFRDTKGREWQVEVNASTVKRVKTLLGVLLTDAVDNKCELFARLHDDMGLIVDVLYALCKPQADAAGVTDEQFGEGFAGDVLTAGHEALIAELNDFFPNAQQRKNLALLREKMLKVTDLIQAEGARRIEGLDAESLAKSVIASFGNSPGSSASTPAPTPSAS